MTPTSPARSLLARVLSADGVRAAAVLTDDHAIVQEGFLGPSGLESVAATVRRVFRDTSPDVRRVEAAFAGGLVLFSASPVGVVVAFGAPDFVPRVRAILDAPTPPSLAPSTDPLGSLARAVDAVGARAGARLGRLVIRNYLRRAYDELAAEHEALDAFAVGIDGRVLVVGAASTVDGAAALPGAGRAVAAWIERFLKRASVIAPELAALEPGSIVRQALDDHALAAVRAAGLFDV